MRDHPSDATQPSRRALLAGAAALLTVANPAAAQLGDILRQGGLGDVANSLDGLMKGMDFKEADELAMGTAYYERFIAQSGGRYNSRRAQEALRRFADPIIRTSLRPHLPWEVVLVDNETVNAWALPGGKLAVHKGVLRYAATPEELAAVLAHELAHAEFSHAVAQMKSKQFTSNLGGLGKQALVDRVSRGSLGSLGGTLTTELLGVLEAPIYEMVTSGYGRDLEYDADGHIISVFQRVGLDLGKAANFHKTMMQVLPKQTEETTSLYSTHPGTEKRVERIEKAVRKAKANNLAPGAPGGWAELKESFPTRRFRRA